jgi:hypothetical protein
MRANVTVNDAVQMRKSAYLNVTFANWVAVQMNLYSQAGPILSAA